jgi:hypothetical protein
MADKNGKQFAQDVLGISDDRLGCCHSNQKNMQLLRGSFLTVRECAGMATYATPMKVINP